MQLLQRAWNCIYGLIPCIWYEYRNCRRLGTVLVWIRLVRAVKTNSINEPFDPTTAHVRPTVIAEANDDESSLHQRNQNSNVQILNILERICSASCLCLVLVVIRKCNESQSKDLSLSSPTLLISLSQSCFTKSMPCSQRRGATATSSDIDWTFSSS